MNRLKTNFSDYNSQGSAFTWNAPGSSTTPAFLDKYNFLENKLSTWGRLLVAAGLLALAGTLPARAQTQTPFGKNDAGTYLFQGATTQSYTLDFTAGTTTAQGTNNGQNGNVYVPAGGTAAVLNAAGFNYADGYIWSQYNGTNQLVRIGTEYVGKAYTFTQPAGYSQTTFTVGDVDVTGKMYMTRGGSAEGINNANTDVYVIDLTQTANPFVASVLSFPYRSFITDWAFSPKDTCLYAINTYFTGQNYMYNENNTKIYRFVTHDRTVNKVRVAKGTRETLGVATGGSTAIAPAIFAAAFMDANGSFYVVASGSGLTHRIDRPDLLLAVADGSATSTSIPAAYVGKFTSGLGNNVDGARNAFSRPTTGSLPVRLVAFTAAAAPNRAVRLGWTTASELNNAYFEVQHSLDGRTFAAVGQVAGRGTSAQASTYAFTDAAPGEATTHYYRLRQVDLDGTATFSPVQTVVLVAGSRPVQLTVAPNPTTPAGLRVQVQYAGETASPAVLTVRNLVGQAVLAQSVTLAPGANEFAPATRLVPPGVYWVELAGPTVSTPGVRVLVAE